MEKKTSDLFLEVLKRLQGAGALDDLILIGSLCLPIYRDYFSGGNARDFSALRTRDADFLIGSPKRIRRDTDIPSLLLDLGFITNLAGTKGQVRLEHPDLILEFIAPTRGPSREGLIKIPKLSVNAVTLRFVDLLVEEPVRVNLDDVVVRLPQPSLWAFQKLIISSRRPSKDKKERDRRAAIDVLLLSLEKEPRKAPKFFREIIPGWQSKIISALREEGESNLVDALTKSI